MAGSSNGDIECSSLLVPSSQDISSQPDPGDIFLTIQRSTTIASKIYNEFFAMPKADFLIALSDYSDVHDLHYVRDIMGSIAKRKTKRAIGPLVERKSGTNMEDNLLKDIYNLYSFGEGSIQSLPKSMLRCDSRYSDQCVQTDSSFNLVCNSDLEILKDELLANFDELKNEVLKSNKSCSATSKKTNSSFTSADRSQSLTVESSGQHATVFNNMSDLYTRSVDCSPKPQMKHKVIIAGGSLLDRMNPRKMKVADKRVKLTKRGDSLCGSIARATNYLSRHSNDHFDLVLLAGTNDLSSRNTTAEDLIKRIDDSIRHLTSFSNIGQIFLCKIPPRLHFKNINSKVLDFNKLLAERFDTTEESVHVIETIKPEPSLYHTDNLHLNYRGLRRLCGTMLSKLYQVLAQSSHRSNRFSRKQIISGKNVNINSESLSNTTSD